MPEEPIALLLSDDLVRRFRTWGQAHRFLDRPCPKRVLDVLLQSQALQICQESELVWGSSPLVARFPASRSIHVPCSRREPS